MQNTPTTPDVEALLKAYAEAQPKAYSEAQPKAYSEAQLGAYKQYLRDIEGARLFGISRTTFRKLVRQGQIPPPIKFGNCSRWERGALLDAAAGLQRRVISHAN
jgi:predicted DNA-binding transcriptional regulator AlpA